MATVHDLLNRYQEAQAALAAAKADAAAKRQAATDAENLVTQDEQDLKDATDAVKEGLSDAGATFVVDDNGQPHVEPDGTINIYEPDATTNGWHATVAHPSNVAIPDDNTTPVTPDQPTPDQPVPTPDQPVPDQPVPPDQPTPSPDQPVPTPDQPVVPDQPTPENPVPDQPQPPPSPPDMNPAV